MRCLHTCLTKRVKISFTLRNFQSAESDQKKEKITTKGAIRGNAIQRLKNSQIATSSGNISLNFQYVKDSDQTQEPENFFLTLTKKYENLIYNQSA